MNIQDIIGIPSETVTAELMHSHINELAHSTRFPFFVGASILLFSIFNFVVSSHLIQVSSNNYIKSN